MQRLPPAPGCALQAAIAKSNTERTRHLHPNKCHWVCGRSSTKPQHPDNLTSNRTAHNPPLSLWAGAGFCSKPMSWTTAKHYLWEFTADSSQPFPKTCDNIVISPKRFTIVAQREMFAWERNWGRLVPGSPWDAQGKSCPLGPGKSPLPSQTQEGCTWHRCFPFPVVGLCYDLEIQGVFWGRAVISGF